MKEYTQRMQRLHEIRGHRGHLDNTEIGCRSSTKQRDVKTGAPAKIQRADAKATRNNGDIQRRDKGT